MTDNEELKHLLLSRIGQEFDGECHLTENEARQIAARLSQLLQERDELRRIISQLGYCTAAPRNPKAESKDMSEIIIEDAGLQDIMADPKLAAARRKLSFHEIRLIMDHARKDYEKVITKLSERLDAHGEASTNRRA